MYSLPLKYVFPLQPLRSDGRHMVRLLGGTPQYIGLSGFLPAADNKIKHILLSKQKRITY
jgi:hypothetical protein